jgi:hypothetical protein
VGDINPPVHKKSQSSNNSSQTGCKVSPLGGYNNVVFKRKSTAEQQHSIENCMDRNMATKAAVAVLPDSFLPGLSLIFIPK